MSAFVCPRQLRRWSRLTLNNEVQRGTIPRIGTQTCVDCGNQATRYDHRDYSFPLLVDPVCSICDSRRGQGLPSINGPCVEVAWFPQDKVRLCGDSCGCYRCGKGPKIEGPKAERRKFLEAKRRGIME